MGKNCVVERRRRWRNRAGKHSLEIKRGSEIYAHNIAPLILQIMEKVPDFLFSNTLLFASKLSVTRIVQNVYHASVVLVIKAWDRTAIEIN